MENDPKTNGRKALGRSYSEIEAETNPHLYLDNLIAQNPCGGAERALLAAGEIVRIMSAVEPEYHGEIVHAVRRFQRIARRKR